MDLLLSASLVASFVAGLAALFAPCCITVLLPSYLASIFREKYKVFLMTFVFFLGILTVFLPLGLGAAALGQFFSRYHTVIFILGGAMLLLLGLNLLIGLHWSLPWHVNPVLKKHNAISVYFLGIFSGIATTCCAPVLAGVLALSILPGSLWWGALYTVSYVLGMVTPLFIIASLLDKFNFTKKFMALRKPLNLKLGSKTISLTWAELISGLAFVGLGALIIKLALTNQLFQHSSYQVSINIFVTKLLNSSQNIIQAIPQWAWAVLILVLLAFLIRTAIKQFTKKSYDES